MAHGYMYSQGVHVAGWETDFEHALDRTWIPFYDPYLVIIFRRDPVCCFEIV